MKKQALFFAAADIQNFPYAVKFWNSMTKFHSPKDVDMIFWTNEKRPEMLKQLPKGIMVADITPFIKDDPIFWYRQKPLLAEQYMDEYELVVGFDVDQIVCGDLNYIIKTKDYDLGTVINWNRVDPQMYGFVDLARLGVPPVEYYNCGMVAMRSKKLVHHWKVLCYSPEFNYMQYKEQDVLNILAHFGNYNVRCFDLADGPANYYAWHGLIVKGEMMRIELRGNDLVVPQGEGDTPFPPADMKIKLIHFAGGQGAQKFNYKIMVKENVAKKIDALIAPTL